MLRIPRSFLGLIIGIVTVNIIGVYVVRRFDANSPAQSISQQLTTFPSATPNPTSPGIDLMATSEEEVTELKEQLTTLEKDETATPTASPQASAVMGATIEEQYVYLGSGTTQPIE